MDLLLYCTTHKALSCPSICNHPGLYESANSRCSGLSSAGLWFKVRWGLWLENFPVHPVLYGYLYIAGIVYKKKVYRKDSALPRASRAIDRGFQSVASSKLDTSISGFIASRGDKKNNQSQLANAYKYGREEQQTNLTGSPCLLLD